MKKKNFSMIELLIVISIIAILGGIVMSSLGTVSGKKDKAVTTALIGNISIAMTKYYSDNGEYPVIPTTPADGIITEAFYNADLDNYYTIPEDFIANGEIVDSWGNALLYVPSVDYASAPTLNGSTISTQNNNSRYYNNDSFQLISLGEDGEFNNGSGDDVVNFIK